MKGQIDYIRVLESLQSLQTLERNVVTARRLVIQRRIALYRSIAGKWDLPEPEIEHGVPDVTAAFDVGLNQDSQENL